MIRRRLPNRRPAVTHDLAVGNARFAATVGFDEFGRPREIFLAGARAGSDLAAVLDDVGVALSVALQHGVSAQAMALSCGRAGSPPAPISVVGAALDLLAAYEPDR
jgi:ribonucleoside-diphosphate reductase alpha chain